MGMRTAQEDRIVICPKFHSDKITVCGVFDGTILLTGSTILLDYLIKFIA